ncbi:hypothetical protein B0H19DRAFT_1258722 [Mycena capillaripes]|nr:hypothetical protein B0H19DRAFT_1258722 [Mycena capillaripes]
MNFSGPFSGWPGSASSPTDSDYRHFVNSPDPSSPEFPLRALSQTPFHPRRPDSGLLWAQSPVPNSIQTADHKALIQHGNMTYTRLLCVHSELQGRYSTLEQAYMLLAKTIPQVFHYIPNPMEIPILSPSISTQPSNIAVSPKLTQFCQEDYPQVKFWKRSDYKEASSDLTTISDSEDKEATLGFLEHSNGERFNPDEVESARKRARTLFATMLNKGWAPLTWSQADATATDYFRQDMLGTYPDIGLCANHWKIDLMATIVYGQ